MNPKITHCTIESRMGLTPPRQPFTPAEAREWVKQLEPTERILWRVVEHYEAGGSLGLNAAEWLETTIFDEPETPAAAPTAASELQRALHRYNERYDNELYLRAVHSLPQRDQDELSFIHAAVALQDVALQLCGARQYGSLTFDMVTPQIIRFWSAFVDVPDEVYDDAALIGARVYFGGANDDADADYPETLDELPF